MNAVILAGGAGTRLAPLTLRMPKPLLPVANRPILEYCIDTLLKARINRISVTLSYKADMIKEYCSKLGGVDFSFSVENIPLGTAGGVKATSTDDVFVVISGDGLTDIDLSQMIQYHYEKKADVTIAVTPSCTPWLYGVVDSVDGYVRKFEEKPEVEGERTVNTGIYVINKSVMSHVNGVCDFSKDLFPLILKNGKIAAYEHRGYWSDVGDFRSYYKANFDVKNGIVGDSPIIGNMLAKNATVNGFVDNCILGRGAVVAEGAVLNDCIVLPDAVVKSSHRSCIISQDTVVPVS